MIPAPDSDVSLGMDFYFTNTPGLGGTLRCELEDFQVEEVYQSQTLEGGRYLILEVEKAGWDTHHLIRELARSLRISQKRLSWAGTKDKWAVTRQRISIMGLEKEALMNVSLPDVKIKVLGSTNRSVGLGDLEGNRFRIKVRDMLFFGQDATDIMNRVSEEMKNGIPNYFGVQRFGEVRPITHLVGESIVKGDLEGAVFKYLAQPFPLEADDTREARERLWKSKDIETAIKEYPQRLRFEIAMLNHLISHPKDYAGSFNVLSFNLKRMFVHAYQSFLFNKMLSLRLLKGIPLTPVEGDIVCFQTSGLPDPKKLELVTADNLNAINRLSSHGRAFVTLPLFGYESTFASGDPGEIERHVINEAGLKKDDFNVLENSELGSPGTRRPAVLMVHPEIHVDGNTADIGFFLQAGSYATVVLREFMKSGSNAKKALHQNTADQKDIDRNDIFVDRYA